MSGGGACIEDYVVNGFARREAKVEHVLCEFARHQQRLIISYRTTTTYPLPPQLLYNIGGVGDLSVGDGSSTRRPEATALA